MAITISIDGITYDGFKEVNIFRSLETLASEFSFTASIQNPAEFPIKLNSACKVYINNVQVVEGYIESISCQTASASHSITIAGRDRTCDVIDSSIFANIEISNTISLKDLIKKILSLNNITGIDVVDGVGSIELFKKEDLTIISAEIGSNVFDIISRYCKARQVLATNDGKGNILLIRASDEVIGRYLLNNLNEQNNNIKSVDFSLNNSERFNKYIIKSQGNPILQSIKDNQLVNVEGSAIDSDIRTSRIKTIVSTSSLTGKVAKQQAIWYNKVAKARSINTNIEIQGFSYDENDKTKIWEPNKLITINDYFWNIYATMLIKSVNYSFDLDSGSITNLTLTSRDAFTLQEDEDTIFNDNEKIGASL